MAPAQSSTLSEPVATPSFRTMVLEPASNPRLCSRTTSVTVIAWTRRWRSGPGQSAGSGLDDDRRVLDVEKGSPSTHRRRDAFSPLTSEPLFRLARGCLGSLSSQRPQLAVPCKCHAISSIAVTKCLRASAICRVRSAKALSLSSRLIPAMSAVTPSLNSFSTCLDYRARRARHDACNSPGKVWVGGGLKRLLQSFFKTALVHETPSAGDKVRVHPVLHETLAVRASTS